VRQRAAGMHGAGVPSLLGVVLEADTLSTDPTLTRLATSVAVNR